MIVCAQRLHARAKRLRRNAPDSAVLPVSGSTIWQNTMSDDALSDCAGFMPLAAFRFQEVFLCLRSKRAGCSPLITEKRSISASRPLSQPSAQTLLPTAAAERKRNQREGCQAGHAIRRLPPGKAQIYSPIRRHPKYPLRHIPLTCPYTRIQTSRMEGAT